MLALYGATVGQLGLLRREMTCNQACCAMIVDPEQADFRFLFYQLIAARSFLKRLATGAAQQNLSGQLIKSLTLPFPALKEQQAIACILGALDDKIELNRRMNRTLEATARAIFKSWFVDFDPVRAKAAGRQPPGLKPEIADLFPDSFVDSELAEIPKGWKVGMLGEIVHEVRVVVSPSEIEPGTPYIALEHIPRRCIALGSWGTADGVASGKLRFRRGDILFGKLRPYFHKAGPAPVEGVCSTDIVVVRPSSDYWYGLAVGHMTDDAFVAHTDRGSTGTKMPRTNWHDMAGYKIAVPSADVAKVHTNFVRPMLEKMRTTIMESHTIASLRDVLLPELISGELRVPDADRIVPRAT